MNAKIGRGNNSMNFHNLNKIDSVQVFFFSRRILVENEPDSYSGLFFRRVRFTSLFICSRTWWTEELQYTKPQNLANTKRNKTYVHNLENTVRLSRCFSLRFFSALLDYFFAIFWIAPKGPPSFVSIFCNTMDVKKSQRVSFTSFGTVTLFKNVI